jgi:anaerobic ribonucleoside-triphosphate reductase activating protein
MKIRVWVYQGNVVDGPGIRAVIFAQGCPHQCRDAIILKPGTAKAAMIWIQKTCFFRSRKSAFKRNNSYWWRTFCTAAAFAELAARVRNLGLDVVTYSGYTFEKLVDQGHTDNSVMKLLENTDILIDGPYVEALKDLGLAFRGSRNQRIIDVKESLQKGRVIELEY